MNIKPNYISAIHDYRTSTIKVFERTPDGKRIVRSYDAPYYYYVEDPKGQYDALNGKRLKKLEFDTRNEFKQSLDFHKTKYESDIAPLDKILMTHYYDIPAPKLRVRTTRH